jgi:SAM-dependent methyltransferase
MDDDRGQVSGGAARVYEAFFVPALFRQWAPRVADAADVRPGQRVLDVACGTGVLAREAARRVGAGSVCGLDCNPGMLAVARAEEPDIEWRRGRAEELPFADGELDAVVSQFGLMFFDDRAGALREMWRVLRPGGMLAVAVWGPLVDTPGYAAMVELLEQLFGERIAAELRAPFCLGDPDELSALLAGAGIAGAGIVTVAGTARFPSIADWVRTDVKGWTLADKIDDEQCEMLARLAEVQLARFAGEGGGVEFASPAHIASARKG